MIVTRKRVLRFFTQEETQQVIRLYEKGLSPKEIGRLVGNRTGADITEKIKREKKKGVKINRMSRFKTDEQAGGYEPEKEPLRSEGGGDAKSPKVRATPDAVIDRISEKLRTIPLNISSTRRGNDNGLRNADEIAAEIYAIAREHVLHEALGVCCAKKNNFSDRYHYGVKDCVEAIRGLLYNNEPKTLQSESGAKANESI